MLGACSSGESRPVRAAGAAADSAVRLPLPRDVVLPGVARSTAPYTVLPAADAGSVTGTVALEGDAPADTTVAADSAAARVCGATFVDRTIARRGDAVAGVAVWLADVPRGKPLPTERRHELRLERCALAPRALAVGAGGTLNVHGRDALDARLRFLRVPEGTVASVVRMTGAGQVVPDERVLAAPGALEVRGELHPWLRAWLLVFDHPYFATTSDRGAFTLDGVPPGTYRLVAWHERLGRIERPVTVAPGQATAVTLRMRAAGASVAAR